MEAGNPHMPGGVGDDQQGAYAYVVTSGPVGGNATPSTSQKQRQHKERGIERQVATTAGLPCDPPSYSEAADMSPERVSTPPAIMAGLRWLEQPSVSSKLTQVDESSPLGRSFTTASIEDGTPASGQQALAHAEVAVAPRMAQLGGQAGLAMAPVVALFEGQLALAHAEEAATPTMMPIGQPVGAAAEPGLGNEGLPDLIDEEPDDEVPDLINEEEDAGPPDLSKQGVGPVTSYGDDLMMEMGGADSCARAISCSAPTPVHRQVGAGQRIEPMNVADPDNPGCFVVLYLPVSYRVLDSPTTSLWGRCGVQSQHKTPRHR